MYAARADGVDMPIEARVRFLDWRAIICWRTRVRRIDRARGGVESIEAPLVLEVEAPQALAQAVLADRLAANDRLEIEVGLGCLRGHSH